MALQTLTPQNCVHGLFDSEHSIVKIRNLVIQDPDHSLICVNQILTADLEATPKDAIHVFGPYTLLRTEYVNVGTNFYSYTFDKNLEDGSGTPFDNLRFDVTAIGKFGQESDAADTLSVTNTNPAAPSGLGTAALRTGAKFAWNPNTEKDISKYSYRTKVTAGGTFSAWIEIEDTAVIRHLTEAEITASGHAVAIYIEVKCIDIFGNESTVSSANVTSLAINILTADGLNVASGGNIKMSAGGDIKLYGHVADAASILFYDPASNLASEISCIVNDQIHWLPGADGADRLNIGWAAKRFDIFSLYVDSTIGLNAYTDANNSTRIGMTTASGASNIINFTATQSGTARTVQFHTSNFYPTTHKTLDCGFVTSAWDDVYADDFQNIADFYHLDDIDDLAAINQIAGSGIIDERTGLEIIDDATLPDFLKSKSKEDNTTVLLDEDGKPYVSLKTAISLCFGAIRQLDKNIELLNKTEEIMGVSNG